MIIICKDKIRKIGWSIILRFRIALYNKDVVLKKKIKNYFSLGVVTLDKDSRIRFEFLKKN